MDEEIDWQAIKTLVFGSGVSHAVFERWLQPFIFSKKEPTALLQLHGGPCAVLAPIQAFILKQCIKDKIQNLSALSEETALCLLRGAMCDILNVCRLGPDRPLTLARVSKEVAAALQDATRIQDKNDNEENASKRMRADPSTISQERSPSSRTSESASTTTSPGHNTQSGSTSSLVDVDTFHTCLTVETFNTLSDLNKYLVDNWSQIAGTKYDILSFLYSVVLTRGPNQIIAERQDMDESLIDPVHGHGSQSLINLLITGAATQNVFDGTKDLCGLELVGIKSQADVGFLSFLECLRYLEVGTHLKSPVYPVWILGSETHLSVLFSQEQRLVLPPSPREKAVLKFKEFDTENSGFVPVDKLKTLMEKAGLFADDEYVDLMRQNIDTDGMGIILLPKFLEEFFPETHETRIPDVFTLYHYNGLDKNASVPVKYIKGEAVMLEGVVGKAENNPMLQTLQTKWQNIAVDWESSPSII